MTPWTVFSDSFGEDVQNPNPEETTMPPKPFPQTQYYPNFKIFMELMASKVGEILLVSSPYDAFILEQDGSLASRIINEYSGLNLSKPPRVTRTPSGYDALDIIKTNAFDLVITMPHLEDMDAVMLSKSIKQLQPDLPIILLAHSVRGLYSAMEERDRTHIDKFFIWTGNSDLLMALVKNVEDQLNVDSDTDRAGVRLFVLVEDSPVYYSILLPLIYKEIVSQTQSVLGEGLNEEHLLLKMRARPKILLAENYEEAKSLCDRYRDYLFGIISDARFPLDGKLNDDAGPTLLSHLRREIPDLPMLMMSSDAENRRRAEAIPAVFLDKNSPNLLTETHDFFLEHLGFGDFIFRLSDGTEVDRASSLRELEMKIAKVPDECIWYHAGRNHFSNWIMGRSEITLANHFRSVSAEEFDTTESLREYLISNIHALRKWRQKGVITKFRAENFDADIMDFVKMGQGSIGGKARGLAFMSILLQENPYIFKKYPDIVIQIPRTTVIGTGGFEAFVKENNLRHLSKEGIADQDIRSQFLHGQMPAWLREQLAIFLAQVQCPLSVRSSSLLEDAHFQPYAGLYETYMIPNNDPDPGVRLEQLLQAIKRVYASTYFENPKAFTRKTIASPQEESMAVIVQELTGRPSGDYFYPAIAGVTQSYNYYPVARMSAEDGIAHIALGMGRIVMEGEQTLRFSPRHPSILPQFSTVDDILVNAQRFFYALKLKGYPKQLRFDQYANLERRDVTDAEMELPVSLLSGTYIPDEHRIRESGHMKGVKVLTFSQVLKHRLFPLPDLLSDLVEIGKKGMGCPVEIEFSVNLPSPNDPRGEFYFLQMRPMASGMSASQIDIRPSDVEKAICYSTQALGNGQIAGLKDIILVKRSGFKAEATIAMANEIGQLNRDLQRDGLPYLLVGPGRWGSADRWLGIPVRWRDISNVGAVIELRNDQLRADPSQGSHFFQNLTALGIPYITITEPSKDFIDWNWFEVKRPVTDLHYVAHIRLEDPLILKIDGQTSTAVILDGQANHA